MATALTKKETKVTKTEPVVVAQTPVAAQPTTVPAKPNEATKQASASIFAKIKDKATHITPEQVDAWQKAWLAMPETRKKYEHLEDAPKVVGEELVAMSNDIVDFVQGQAGGKSEVFQKVKNFFNNPFDFLKPKTPATTAPQVPVPVVQAPPAPVVQAKKEEMKAVAEKTHTKAKKVMKK